MPRNNSGTYSVPTSFTTGTTISSSDVNGNFSDIGAEITNSLPRDGQAGMTGSLKAATGSAAAPSITFGNDPNTGFFNKSGDVIGVSAGGVEVGTIGTSGLADVNGNQITAFPSGTAMLFVQTNAPTGWTKSTTHNDKALRVVSGTASSGGTTAFTSVFTSRTIAQANLPNVNLSSASLSASSSSSSTAIGSNGVTNGNWNTGGGSRTVQSISSGAGTLDSVTPAITTTTSISGNVPLGGSGTAMNFNVNYVDVIICTKD